MLRFTGFLGFLIAAFFIASPWQALADDVVLKLKSGGLTVQGKLLSFDGETYVIETVTLGTVKAGVENFICTGDACPKAPAVDETHVPPPSFRIRGSNTVGSRLLPAMIRDYAASMGANVETVKDDAAHAIFNIIGKNGESIVTIDLERRGSESAFSALASGEADIGSADRPISDEEIGLLAQAGFPDMNRPGHEHVIGLDSVVIIVSPKNNISSLSIVDLARIFSGEAQDWAEFGLPPAPIKVFSAGETSGDFRIFYSVILKPFGMSLTARATRSKSHGELAEAVASDPNAIGFVSLAQLELAKPLAIKDTCELTHEPSRFGIKSGEFPLVRNLYFYTTKLANKHAAAFLRYAISPAASSALRAEGFTDNEIQTEPFDKFGDKVIGSVNAASEDFDLDLMRQLIETLKSGRRLSATMRFERGSAELDSESVQQLPEIAAFLRARTARDKKILIAGYSDTIGPFDHNRRLSLDRAQAVRNALLVTAHGELRPEDVKVEGFGELFPVACNDTAEEREKNRRVEIWLLPEDTEATASIISKQP